MGIEKTLCIRDAGNIDEIKENLYCSVEDSINEEKYKLHFAIGEEDKERIEKINKNIGQFQQILNSVEAIDIKENILNNDIKKYKDSSFFKWFSYKKYKETAFCEMALEKLSENLVEYNNLKGAIIDAENKAGQMQRVSQSIELSSF